MSGFGDLLDDLDAAIEDHLCDDARYLAPGGDPVPVRLQLDHPRSVERMQSIGFTRARPIMRVARAAVPDLVEGHRFQMVLAGGVLGDVWEVASAPEAPDDGRWWVFAVQPG